MRHSIALFAVIAALLGSCGSGCVTTEPQTVEAIRFNTFADTWAVAEAAYGGFCERAVTGKVSAETEAKVDAKWNDFRRVFVSSFKVVQQDWSALTPAALDTVERELLALIRKGNL